MNASKNRPDTFGPIHKAIRCALADLMIAMGRASFADDVQAKRVVADLEEVLLLCESHIAHEDRFVFPRLRTRLSGPLESIESAHVAHTRTIAELRSLGGALLEAPPAKRPLVGQTLYIHFSVFIGEELLHMAEEERFVAPLIEKLFTDEEIQEVQARIQASLSPDEVNRAAKFFMRSMVEGG